MIGAISLAGVVELNNIYGAIDGLTFEACVVMDNAKIHLGETIREEIEGAGARLVYLSPHSPDFSPIENFWSKMKAILKKCHQELI